MTLKSKKFISALVCVLLLSAVCLAAGEVLLSPALDHIKEQINLKKCGVANTDVTFDTGDFDGVLCNEAEFIRIDSLPSASVGTLMLGTSVLSENQLVARKDFDKIVLVPNENTTGCAEFEFSNASPKQSETQVLCTVNILDELNLAPQVGEQTVSTSRDISAFTFLKAADPENDNMFFEVVSYPANGTITISDDSSGYFCYTPKAGFTGTDCFSYTASDVYGNKSDVAEVNVIVSRPGTNTYYDDMQDHWAHSAAVDISAMGLMNGALDAETGAYNFYPDEQVSRGDFLAMALICAGKESQIEFVDKTSFDDDELIPVNIKSYVEYARTNGIVNGYTLDNGQTVFAGSDPISRAEAAVIVDRILSLPDNDTVITGQFDDCASVESWAGQALANLNAIGIFKGNGYGEMLPDNNVTRAETAEILCSICDYSTETVSSAQKSKPSILNLFGLLGD